MVSDHLFFTNFRNSILGVHNQQDENNNDSYRVKFHVSQFDMIPADHRDLFTNITRTYPSSPIYLFIGLGVIGTNIARYSAVRRIGAHRQQTERTGSLYKFIAPSRLGKRIALSIVSETGQYIEKIRAEE